MVPVESPKSQIIVIKTKRQDELLKASSIIAWNKRLLSLLGLWPESTSDVIFWSSAVYYLFHLALDYVTLYLVLGNLRLMTKLFIEVLTYSHISLRLLLLHKHNRTFGILFSEISRDFESENYKSEEETRAFLEYNVLAKNVIKILLTFSSFLLVLYFFKPMVFRHFAKKMIRLAHKNVTAPYLLPNSFYKFHKITTDQTYAITYATQLPFGVFSTLISSTTDCLVLSLGCHLCGRLSALSHRIRNMNIDSDSQEFKIVIQIHQHLLRIGKMVEDSLCSLMFCHLLIASALLCIVLFQTLIYMAPGKRIHLINIFFLIFQNILRLYSHCYVGEYLIQESDAVHSAFYECKWYALPLTNRKLITLNLLRCQSPIRFTAGGFGIFSIAMFSEVLKTAMAYLSVLRNFM